MKKWLMSAICVMTIFSILSGCSGEKDDKQTTVNSGQVDQEYMGDPNPVLEETYKQSETEKNILETVKKEISESEDELNSGALSVH